MWRIRARTVSNEPRRTDLRVRMPNHASTMLSQEAPFGVKWNWTAGCSVSHVCTAGVECVDELSSTTCSADRKSTRLNSSHVKISYAVFCLKKKKKKTKEYR